MSISLLVLSTFISDRQSLQPISTQLYYLFITLLFNSFGDRNMFMYKQQLDNERKFAKENKAEALLNYKDKLMSPCMAHFEAWKSEPVPFIDESGKLRQDLVEIIPAIYKLDAEATIWHILSSVILGNQLTLQAVMGMYFERIEVEMPYRKGRVIEPFIAAVLASPYIELQQLGKYLHLVCTQEINLPLTEYAYVLPTLSFEPVKTNKDAGYETIPFHVITGGKLKQHSGEVCLDHINRLNAVNYTTDNRIMSFTQPTFDSEPKYLDKESRYETEVETEGRRKQFTMWEEQLPHKLAVMQETGNKFHFKNRYCTRGRTYVKAWHLDYIGNKFIRAIVNTSVKEHVEGANKYL